MFVHGRLAIIGLAIILCLSIRSQGRADGYAPPGELVSLLHEPSQRDNIAGVLNLSEEQRKKIEALIAQFRQEIEQLQAATQLSPDKQRALINDSNRKIAALLQPAQLEKLNRISLKEKGASALLDPTVAEKLRLTEKQKERLKQIEEDAERKRRYLLDHLPRVTAAALDDLEVQQKKDKANAMTAVLDERQRQEWQHLSSGL
jgi:hypothetical protein